jgi:aerobic carbon-monoxide dehydrogenase medium subunit
MAAFRQCPARATIDRMKPAPFEYHAPTTVEDALALLAAHAADDGRILAGGQSLVPTMAFRLARPGHLIDINGIEALSRVESREGMLSIGACVRHAAFHQPVVDGPLGALLSAVVRHIAHYPIRQRGTFCGSVAHADPASEWCCVAATLDAGIVARSARGERVIPAAAFFEGVMSTTLEEDELLAEIRLPLLPEGTRFGFHEFSRRAGDFAIAMALATFRLDGGRIAEPRIGIGGAEAHARRIGDAEAALNGAAPGAEAFAAAADAAAEAIDPMTDVNTTAEYRRDLVRALVRRALEDAAR